MTLVFVPQSLSFHWEILIMLLSQFSLTFCQTKKRMPCAHSHGTAYDYFRDDWDGLCDHSRDVPWKDIFELMYLYLTVNIKSSLSSLSAAFATAIANRNNLFHLYQQNKSSESKVKLVILKKRFFEAAEIANANKTRISYIPETRLSRLLVNC